MSGNHNHSLGRAIEIVEAAAKSGVHALKLQTYTADTITINVKEGEFFIDNKDNLWKGQSLYELYQKAYTPWDWHESIMKRANELGMVCFSTPFDETAVEFLEELNVPAYKIASSEIIHLPLVKKVAATGKPIIISTGMANLEEIKDCVEIYKANSNRNFMLLHCVSNYPCSNQSLNMLVLPKLASTFNCLVGYSDHSVGNEAATISVTLGSVLIEKHFTIDKNLPGPDQKTSVLPKEFYNLVQTVNRTKLILGKSEKKCQAEELQMATVSRKSLTLISPLKKGEKLSKKHVTLKRPGTGLFVKELQKLLGHKARKPLSVNHQIRHEDFD